MQVVLKPKRHFCHKNLGFTRLSIYHLFVHARKILAILWCTLAAWGFVRKTQRGESDCGFPLEWSFPNQTQQNNNVTCKTLPLSSVYTLITAIPSRAHKIAYDDNRDAKSTISQRKNKYYFKHKHTKDCLLQTTPN